MASRRRTTTMSLADLRDHLDREEPFTTPEGYSEVMDRRYALAADLGFNTLDVLRSRLAEQWEPSGRRRGKR